MERPVRPISETGRLEAFSDGVIAIIITIMVLEIHPPEHPTLAALTRLWPVLLAYALSFTQVAIYWVNHHQLLDRAERSTNGLRWANMIWLFSASLIPLGTAWFGDFPHDPVPTAVYMFTLMLPAIAYVWLEKEATCGSHRDETNRIEHAAQQRKTWVSALIYAIGIVMAFLNSFASLGCVLVVALLWIAPGSHIDRWFGAER